MLIDERSSVSESRKSQQMIEKGIREQRAIAGFRIVLKKACQAFCSPVAAPLGDYLKVSLLNLTTRTTAKFTYK